MDAMDARTNVRKGHIQLPLLLLLCRCAILALLLAAPALMPVRASNTTRLTDPAHTITLGYMQFLDYASDATSYQIDAMELLVATQLALEDLNSNRYEVEYGLQVLPGYTVELDIRNSEASQVQATHLTQLLLDPDHTDEPVPVIMGFVTSTELEGALIASQPYQAPIMTPFVSTSSLATDYPNLMRYCATDQIEAFAQIALYNTFGWTKLAVLYNSYDSSSTQLVTALQSFTGSSINGSLAEDMEITTFSYSYSTSGTAAFPTITTQLQAIAATGIRIILLAGVALDVPYVFAQANALGLIGSPYNWLGTNQWCFDTSLFTSVGSLLDGVLCTQNYLNSSTLYFSDFSANWAEKYAKDPASTFNRSQPSMSGPAYDQIWGVTYALTALMNLRIECNLSVVGSNGRPFSGLIPPDQDTFDYLDYNSDATSSGQTYEYTESSVPITAPDVCPWLLYQSGQGRVLTRLMRRLPYQGSTGGVIFFQSGDRVSDVSVYNIYNGSRLLVGVATSQTMFTEFGTTNETEAAIMQQFSYITSVPYIPTFTVGTISDAWRDSYNASNFTTTGFYEVAAIEMMLRTGGSFSSNVLTDWIPSQITWVDGTSDVPLDYPVDVIVIEGPSEGARITVWVLACILAVYNFLLLGFQIKYRGEKLIKMTSPWMNVVFLTGSFGILVYIILLGLNSTDFSNGVTGYVQLCHTKYALLAISFSAAFGSVFAKLYRLDIIFNSKNLHVRAVKDRDILLLVGILMVIDIIGLLIWEAYDPFYRSLSQSDGVTNPDNVNQMLVSSRERCYSGHFTIWVVSFLVYKGALLVFALYLALRVRKIQVANLNDSKWIVISIYQVVLVSILLIVIALVVMDQPTAFYLIESLGMLYLVFIVVTLLFVPRAMTILWGYDFTTETSGSTHTPSKQGHADTSSENNALRTENEKLKIKLQGAQHDLADLRRAAHAAGVDLKVTHNSGGHPGARTPSGGSRRTSKNVVTAAAVATHATPSLLPLPPHHHKQPSALHSLTAASLQADQSVRIHVHLENEATPPPPTGPSVVHIDDPLHGSPAAVPRKSLLRTSGEGPTVLPGSTAYNSQIGSENFLAFGPPPVSATVAPTAGTSHPSPSHSGLNSTNREPDATEMVVPPRAASYAAPKTDADQPPEEANNELPSPSQ